MISTCLLWKDGEKSRLLFDILESKIGQMVTEILSFGEGSCQSPEEGYCALKRTVEKALVTLKRALEKALRKTTLL